MYGVYRVVSQRAGAFMNVESDDLSSADTLEVGLVGRLKQFLENEGRSCSMDPMAITTEYVCRMLGGTMRPEDLASALEKAKALLR